MSKSIYTITLILAFALFSCKNENKEAETAKEEKKEITIQLSNYTDNNWTAGVAKELNMFIVDNTKSNEEIIKNAKELELNDGSIVKVTGYNVADPFIQVNLDTKAIDYKDAASHPNQIIVR